MADFCLFLSPPNGMLFCLFLFLNHFFTGRFVSHDMDHDVNYNCNIAIDYPDCSHEALMLFQNPKFEIKRLDLSSLCKGSEWASVLSSCHDIVLCVAKMKEQGFRYFICDFLTMQKIALPVPADWLEAYPFSHDIHCAFICEPYCARDTQGQCTLSDECPYRVWDLKDYENGAQVCLYTLASQNESVFDLFANWNDLRMLAPHPFDVDVVFLSFNDIIASCNIRTGATKYLLSFPEAI